jgi:superfamily II DNA or RNA helicase
MILRPYQIDLVDRTREAFRRSRRVCMQLSTGGGKTPTASHIVHSIQRRGKRIWWLAHKDFLVEQASEKLRSFGIRHGVVRSGHFPDPRHTVLVCSIGTMRNRFANMPPPNWIVTDECHHAASPTWAKLLGAFPNAYQLGLTATPERPDGQGLDSFYDELVCGATAAELMQWNLSHPREGLCPYHIVSAKTVHADGVRHTKSNEYNMEDLGHLMTDKKILGDFVKEYENLPKRVKFVTFAPTIEVSKNIEAEYRAKGHAVLHLDGTMDKTVIRRAIKDYARGELMGITSRDILLEGLDLQGVGMVQWGRHTESLVVFKQGNGRGWRPDTDEVFFVDHVGNFGQMVNGNWAPKHGLPDKEHEWSLQGRKAREQKEKVITYWQCGKCFANNEQERVFCKDCRTARPVRNRKEIEIDASVQLEVIDVEAIRREDRMAQGMARGVDQLMKLGISMPRAQHIEAAREEKRKLRAMVRKKAVDAGDLDAVREHMQWKPKALRSYLEGPNNG